jgi:amino acid adenylation domain-containing protein
MNKMDQILQDYKVGKATIDDVLEQLQLLQAQPQRRELSEGQRGLWWLQKMAPRSTGYHIPIALRLHRQMDPSLVQKALDALLLKHPILTSVFVEHNGQPHLMEGAFKKIVLEQDHLGVREDHEVLQVLKQRVHRPMSIDSEPLINAILYSDSGNESVLLLVIHHLVCDGRSVQVLLATLLRHLRQLVLGEPMAADSASSDQADFVAWQKALMNSEAGQQQLMYWQKQLQAPLPLLELPTDHPRHNSSHTKGRTHIECIDSALSKKLRDCARSRQVSLSVVLLAAFKLMLSRYSGQSDVIVGMPTLGRHEERFESSVGYFVNMVAVRSQVKPEQTMQAFFQDLQLTVVDALDHSAYPFPALVRQLKVPRAVDHSPVFQVAYEYLNSSVLRSDSLAEIGGDALRCEAVSGLHQEGEYELTLEVREQTDHLNLHFKFDPELFEEATIRRFAQQYLGIVNAVVNHPDQPIRDYAILSDDDRHTLLHAWNNTQLAYQDRCVHEMFADQAERTPQAIALSFEGETLNYAQLLERVDTLARYLQMQGIGPDKLVGVCLDRSIDMVVALLGVLQSGGAYVPLDPNYPIDRLQYMLTDSGASLLLTDTRQADRLKSAMPDEVKQALIDDWGSVVQLASCMPEHISKSGMQHLAYVIYTSGSTGRPKGVMIEHRALTNFLVSMAARPGLNAEDRLIAITTYSFDIAGLELFLPLVVGARCCVVASGKTRVAEQLMGEIDRIQPTVMQATPATWMLLSQVGWRNPQRIKALCGGEPLPHQLKQWFIDTGTPAWNMFGPTETTIWSTVGEITNDDVTTIGRPIANTSVYVLDEHSQPVPVGVPGELHIGGHGLARGYLNQPGLTAEKFMPSPFHSGERLYKTGDLARWHADGQIEHLGRIDTQVKLRGYRIELGEIEAQLSLHPAVGHCAVVLHDGNQRKQLVAFFVRSSSDGTGTASSTLREHLKTKLPEFMVPTRFVPVSSLPLTPSGKIDRQHLSRRELAEAAEISTQVPVSRSPSQNERSGSLPSHADVQETVLTIWRDALARPDVEVDEGFFDAGGDSLLASTGLKKYQWL